RPRPQRCALRAEISMSGICGFVGGAAPGVLDAMLAAIDYRGDRTDTVLLDGAGLGYRWWEGRPGSLRAFIATAATASRLPARSRRPRVRRRRRFAAGWCPAPP